MSEIPGALRASRLLGALLVEAGSLSATDVERILLLHKQENLRFGEAAVRLGLVSRSDIEFALSRQFEYAYLRSNAGDRPISDELIAAYQPFSPRVDQLRAVRSQLFLRWYNKSDAGRMFAVVGTERGEGRSYLAANLAIVFSQLGESTLLIDANLRAPRQHELFMLQNKVGLSTVLSGRSRDEAIIRVTELVDLFVLPAGPTPPNPLELVTRPSLYELLNQVRSSFSVVIIDTPALSSGEDAALIAVRAGAALAVARSATTRVAAFTDMTQGLTNSGVTVLGSVLNDVPT